MILSVPIIKLWSFLSHLKSFCNDSSCTKSVSSVLLCVKYASFCSDSNQKEINSVYVTNPKLKVLKCVQRFKLFYSPYQDIWTDLTNVTADTQSMHKPILINTHSSGGSNMQSLFPFVPCAVVPVLCNFMRISITKYVYSTFSVTGISLCTPFKGHILAKYVRLLLSVFLLVRGQLCYVMGHVWCPSLIGLNVIRGVMKAFLWYALLQIWFRSDLHSRLKQVREFGCSLGWETRI